MADKACFVPEFALICSTDIRQFGSIAIIPRRAVSFLRLVFFLLLTWMDIHAQSSCMNTHFFTPRSLSLLLARYNGQKEKEKREERRDKENETMLNGIKGKRVGEVGVADKNAHK